MKSLAYRSIDSMLKRENVKDLFILANAVESATWKKELARLVAKQESTAFELREISIGVIDDAGSKTALVYNDEVGALAIARSGSAESMTLLALCVLLEDFLDSLNDKKQASRSQEIIGWWQENEHLLAELDGGTVSFNLKDASLNHSNGHDFAECLLSAGRTEFWKHLLARYENQLEIEEDKLIDETAQVLWVKAPIRQPAFEYVEDF